MQKVYSIYSEGAQFTGGSCKAVKLGSCSGTSFRNACDNFAKINPTFRQYYQDGRYWGCKLFDNIYDAQKSFG